MQKTDLWEQLKNETRPIVLYGTGNAAERINAFLKEKGITISGVFASDSFVRNKVFDGLPVTSLSETEKQFDDFVILLCFGTHLPEVISNINAISKKHELFAPDIPVVGEGLFDLEHYMEKEKEINALKNILADDLSRQTLDAAVSYKLSGKLKYLYECEAGEDDVWRLASKNKNDLTKNLLDLGAYTGDTAEEFARVNPEYESIIAVEPESRNFRKLCEYAGDNEKITCLNFGIGDKEEIIEFSKGSGRGSLSKKTVPTKFTTIDKLLFENPNHSAEYNHSLLVKMDLEGNEAKAIEGGKNFIEKFHPNLFIAAYHRLDDLTEIPKQILTLHPGYKVYLRHSPCIPAWEFNYIFISE